MNSGVRVSILIITFFLLFDSVIGQPRSTSEILFDGSGLDKWRGFQQDSIPDNWFVNGDMLCADGTGGDLITKAQYENFELSFEWRLSKGGNSGVFFHVREKDHEEIWYTGIEMELLDNKHNPMAKNPKNQAGAVFALYAPTTDATKPAGSFNTSSIIVKNGSVEYWINDIRVNAYEMWTDKWYQDRKETLHNAQRKPEWGEYRIGHIALQDETLEVCFRNIRIETF